LPSDQVNRIVARFTKNAGLRRNPHTLAKYTQELVHFCIQTGKWDKADCLRYIDNMISDNFKGATITTKFYMLKACFDTLGEEFPINESDLPRGRFSYQQNQPVLPVDVIREMVESVKSEYSPEAFYLAISTIYGLRREELSKLTPKSFTETTIMVDTAKHGMPRKHILAEQIRPIVLARCQVADTYTHSVTSLSGVYHHIAHDIGRESPFGEGWHAIRRSLITGLLGSGLPDSSVRNYMRWAKPRNDIMYRYYQPNTEEIDREVFKVHPFLEMWS
jgi:hypothetical protein